MKFVKCYMVANLILAMLGSKVFAVTEVNWWHAMGGQLGEMVDKFASDFNKTQSEYKINAIYKGNYTETMTSAIAAFRAKKQPHIVQVFEVGTATMMAAEEKGAVYPIYKLMSDSGESFDQSEYLPAVISYYTTTDGKLLSLPFNSSTPVLWYNKSKLDELGIEVPITWEELEIAAEKAKEAGVVAPLSFGWQSWSVIENYSTWHNIPVGSKENGFAGLDTELTFNNAAVVNNIQRIADMGKKGLFKYGGRRGDSRAMFVNGECIFWINSSAYYGGFKKDIKNFEFSQAMLPLDTNVSGKRQNSIIGGATLWVLSGHKKKEYKGVAKFFKWLSEAEQQAYWHQNTGYVPITLGAYKLSQKQGFYQTNPNTDVAIKQLSLNAPTPSSKGLRFGNFVQIRDVINEELEAIWSGKKNARNGLDDAVSRGNKLLRKFESANR